jgi:signal transduction histidine kinase
MACADVAAARGVQAEEAGPRPAPAGERPAAAAAAAGWPSPGALVADVAHRVNNPLAVISANVTFALEELDRAVAAGGAVHLGPQAVRELRAALADAASGAGQVREVVRSLRALSRPRG